jgi:CRP-like cAMP-binding protein
MSTKSITPAPLTITDAARHLGVTREHLSRVIHGHRESRSLRARYSDLVSRVTNRNPKPA